MNYSVLRFPALKKLSLITAVIFVSACGTTPKKAVPKPTAPAIQYLINVAESIREHDQDLAAIESARYLEAKKNKIPFINTNYLPSLNEVVSLGHTYVGPLDKLIVKLSAMAGLNPPRFIGVKPAQNIIVSINTDYRPIIDMLVNAGTEAGSRAHVTLKVRERLLEVEYVVF